MTFPSLTDTLSLEFTAGERPGLGRLLLMTALISEFIAVPVALVLTSAGGNFPQTLGIATIYSQCIGFTCAMVGWATFDRVAPLQGRTRRIAVTVQYFASGVVGAEAARRISPVVFGTIGDSSPPLVSWAIGASIALIVGFVLMTVRHLRAKVVATELDALQSRINPHFLFNTLNSIAALIREDPARAEAMTLRLSSLFRYSLQASRGGLVSLEEEMTIVDGYLAIEQERLADRLGYRIDVDPALLSLRVPALVLQPLVENAVKHGIANSVRGGNVTVRVWRDGDVVHLTVEDTGDGTGAPGGTGEGLNNVRARLRGTFGRRADLTLERTGERTVAHATFVAGARA